MEHQGKGSRVCALPRGKLSRVAVDGRKALPSTRRALACIRARLNLTLWGSRRVVCAQHELDPELAALVRCPLCDGQGSTNSPCAAVAFPLTPGPTPRSSEVGLRHARMTPRGRLPRVASVGLLTGTLDDGMHLGQGAVVRHVPDAVQGALHERLDLLGDDGHSRRRKVCLRCARGAVAKWRNAPDECVECGAMVARAAPELPRLASRLGLLAPL